MKTKTLDKRQIMLLCGRYNAMHMFDKPRTLIEETVYQDYLQMLDGTYEYPLPKEDKKISLDIKPVQGAWSRTASVERSTHAKDILQPIKKDGTINKHFVDVHGTRSLQKELKISDREIRANVEKYG